MKPAAIVLFALLFSIPSRGRETEFLAVVFTRGATAVVQLDNEGRSFSQATIERYSAGGKRLDRISRIVPGHSAIKVRLNLSSEKTEFGWFRVIENGDSIEASSVYEWLNGNDLTSVNETAVDPHPASPETVRKARLGGHYHRYTYDTRLGGVAYFFVNLSEYPVHAGMCQENQPDCSVSEAPLTVAPLAMVSLPIDPERRFLVFESQPGFSAAAPLAWTAGLKKIFGATSSIQFGPPVQ